MAAMMNNGDVPLAAEDYYRGRGEVVAARRGGFFAGLRDRRLRDAVTLLLWAAAGVVSTTTAPSLAANPDHVMVYFILLMAGVVLLLLTVAATDHPRLERAADRLDGQLRAMLML